MRLSCLTSSSHVAKQDIKSQTSVYPDSKGVVTASVFCFVLPALLSAQSQPAVADNNQDEVINLSRAVDAHTDSFRILRSGDKAELNRYVSKAYRLQNANPYEILPYIRGAAALEKGSVSTVWNPAAVDGPIALLQVNVPEFQLPYFDALIAAYDVKEFVSGAGDIKFSYRTKYRSAVEVASFIKSTTISGDGAITGDAATNTLYVSDSPSDFRRVIAQIQFYDIPVPQLDLEISVIELTDIDQTSLGLDWDAWKTSLSGKLDLKSAQSSLDLDPGADLDSYSNGYDAFLSLDATTLAKFLNYLTDTGKAEVRARTNLTVSNGTAAILRSSTQIPEFQYVHAAVPGKSNLTETAPQPGDPSSEGLTIRIQPIIAMSAARMDVDLTLRSPVGVSKTGAPIYSDQQVGANLTLGQGQLYKLGGLRRSVMTKERKGFPLLKEIPVVKYLFSNETTIMRETELYVFLRPTWTAPMLPVSDGMQVDKPTTTTQIEQILTANPSISISGQDAELLSDYFESQASSGK